MRRLASLFAALFLSVPGLDCAAVKIASHTPPPIAHIVGEINSELADRFAAEMKAAEASSTETGDAILVEIDSPGGEDEAGHAISKTIERTKIPVVCVVDGMAASMAFYVLQSCDLRIMTKRSSLMTHHAAISGMLRSATADDLESLAAMLRATDQAYAEWCIHRTNISYEEWKEKTQGKMWWFSWNEALERHAVDEVY